MTEPKHAPASVAAQPQSRARLYFAVFAAAAWTLFLVLMWLTAANPRLVSADQLRTSDAVIQAKFPPDGSDRLKITRVFSGELKTDEEVTVLNLGGVEIPLPGQEAIFSLSRFRGDYVITVLDGQRTPPLVYRAGPEVIDQVKQALRDKRAL